MKERGCVVEDHYFLQQFIYFMNDDRQRDYLVRYHQEKTNTKRSHKWLGTLKVEKRADDDQELYLVETRQSLTQYFQKKQDMCSKYSNILFNVCLFYGENRVHYVAFVWNQTQLVSFDPGISFYPEGQLVIVPFIEKQFKDMAVKKRRLGECRRICWRRRKTGVQYNEDRKSIFPADSFCQTWTLYFTIRLLYVLEEKHGEGHIESVMVDRICKIPPRDREFYLISMFIFPTLMYHGHLLSKFVQELNDTNRSYDGISILSFLWNDIDRCFPR